MCFLRVRSNISREMCKIFLKISILFCINKPTFSLFARSLSLSLVNFLKQHNG